MKKIKYLTRFSSDWQIVETYSFLNCNYSVSDSGIVFNNNKVISNAKPDGKKSIEVRLIDDAGILRRFKLHQIVGQVYYPDGIKDGYSIDHINRFDRLNNSASNLRWTNRNGQYTNRENIAYKIKPVVCINTGKQYPSCQHAESDLGLVKNTVSRVARGERKSIHNYTFSYLQ